MYVKLFDMLRFSHFFLTVTQAQTLVVREAFVLLPLIDKVNASVTEGRVLLNATISKLRACGGQGIIASTVCVAGAVAGATTNATRIAGEVRDEAIQIAQAVGKIPSDAAAAVGAYIETSRVKLDAIGKEVEKCVLTPPPP
jgi:hypothetical protein